MSTVVDILSASLSIAYIGIGDKECYPCVTAAWSYVTKAT